ncbi:MAG TPA: hypothetical protein VK043_10025 [Burkholderiales bacterium]|nr:hypothetical protein [Burkholderiales bacterium]
MWVILLEIVLALALAIFIVWWTWPKKRPPRDPQAGDAGREDDKRGNRDGQ